MTGNPYFTYGVCEKYTLNFGNNVHTHVFGENYIMFVFYVITNNKPTD